MTSCGRDTLMVDDGEKKLQLVAGPRMWCRLLPAPAGKLVGRCSPLSLPGTVKAEVI
jgi:hypothetical protein